MNANPNAVPGLQTAIEQAVKLSQGLPLAPAPKGVVKWSAEQLARADSAKATLDRWFGAK